jgi:hypothetical protein
MRRMFLFVGLLLPLPTFAQSPGTDRTIRVPAQIESPFPSPYGLLDQASQLAEQLSPGERARHMQELISMAAKMHHRSLRQWVGEFFELVENIPRGHHRSYLQKQVLTSVADIDSELAFKLLADLEPLSVAIPNLFSPVQDLRAEAAAAILPRYWRESRSADFTAIRAVSQRLGDTGQYPFLGTSAIFQDIAAKDLFAARTLFYDGLQYYERTKVSWDAYTQIPSFLKNAKGALSDLDLQTGIQVAVTHILAEPDRKTMESSTYARSTALEVLRNLLPLVQQLRPDLQKQIFDTYPAVQAVRRRGVSRSQEVPEFLRLGTVERLATTDPNAALEMSKSFADPSLRASALASVVEGSMQQTDAAFAVAAEGATQIEKILNSISPDHKSEQLSVLVSLARAQASRRDARAWETVNRGLDLAKDQFEADMRKELTAAERARLAEAGLTEKPASHCVCFNIENDLMKLAVENQPVNAMSWLSQQTDPLLKSYLLISAAQGLWKNQKSPSSPARTPAP